MISGLDVETLLWTFATINVCFTLGMLLLRTDEIWSGTRYWIAGNIFSVLGIGLLLEIQNRAMPVQTGAVPAMLVMAANLCKTLFFMRRSDRRKGIGLGLSLIGSYAFLVFFVDDLLTANITIGAAGIIGAVFPAWIAYLCLTSPRWHKSRGSNVFVVASVLISLFYAFAGIRGLSISSSEFLFSQSPRAQVNLFVSMSFFIISHVCLIAMLVSQLSRTLAIGQIRQRKQAMLMRQAERHAAEMAVMAEEKQSLLEILTHEVRQPLNNAQAALNDVAMDLAGQKRAPEIGQRLQSIIDQVVLALSNAIIGATMLERKTRSLLVRANIGTICELACGDAGLDWQSRIQLHLPENPVFSDVDPILLRLAIRNLVDNGLKHSAADQKIHVSVSLCEKDMTVRIKVTNSPITDFIINPSIFERGMKGTHSSPSGKGLGLYIVREIASLHHGRVTASKAQDGRTCFELTIPA